MREQATARVLGAAIESRCLAPCPRLILRALEFCPEHGALVPRRIRERMSLYRRGVRPGKPDLYRKYFRVALRFIRQESGTGVCW